METYIAAGGDAFNVLEPVDGFHESQTGSMLIAKTVFEDIQANRPSWIPAINPFNAQIQQLFGNQGGY